MAEVTLTINGKNYNISCESGQEQRVLDLGHYVDQRIKAISRSGAATNESHLLVLTALMLSDEVFDVRDMLGRMDRQVVESERSRGEEGHVARHIEQLAGRIDQLAARIQSV